MEMFSFFLVLVLLKVIDGGAQEIFVIESAVSKGAVCLDGSPPAYEMAKGFGEGEVNWMVMVEGGGWCHTTEDCYDRQRGWGGSSHFMKPINFTEGIFSNNKDLNPDFYNWNKIVMRYCDGSSFTGDVEEVDPATNNHHRGARVFDAIVEALSEQGMSSASNVLFAGFSAGALTVILNCDKFRAFLPESIRVKCFSDGGYFPHVKDLAGLYYFEGYFDAIVEIHGSAKNLPLGCTSVMKPSLCFYPQYTMPYIRTPMFILHSAFDLFQVNLTLANWATGLREGFLECLNDLYKCSPKQQERLKEFRSDFLDALSVVGNSSSNGYFINSCYTHAQSIERRKWSGDCTLSKVDDKSISEAVSDWFFDRSTSQRIEDQHLLPYYCN